MNLRDHLPPRDPGDVFARRAALFPCCGDAGPPSAGAAFHCAQQSGFRTTLISCCLKIVFSPASMPDLTGNANAVRKRITSAGRCNANLRSGNAELRSGIAGR